MGSGWFNTTEPSLTTSSQGKLGVDGNCTLDAGGSTAPNLSKPFQIALVQTKEGEKGCFTGGSTIPNLL